MCFPITLDFFFQQQLCGWWWNSPIIRILLMCKIPDVREFVKATLILLWLLSIIYPSSYSSTNSFVPSFIHHLPVHLELSMCNLFRFVLKFVKLISEFVFGLIQNSEQKRFQISEKQMSVQNSKIISIFICNKSLWA